MQIASGIMGSYRKDRKEQTHHCEKQVLERAVSQNDCLGFFALTMKWFEVNQDESMTVFGLSMTVFGLSARE